METRFRDATVEDSEISPSLRSAAQRASTESEPYTRTDKNRECTRVNQSRQQKGYNTEVPVKGRKTSEGGGTGTSY